MHLTPEQDKQIARENRVHGALRALRRKGWFCFFDEARMQVSTSKGEGLALQTYDWDVREADDYKNFLDFVCVECNPSLWAIRQRERSANTKGTTNASL